MGRTSKPGWISLDEMTPEQRALWDAAVERQWQTVEQKHGWRNPLAEEAPLFQRVPWRCRGGQEEETRRVRHGEIIDGWRYFYKASNDDPLAQRVHRERVGDGQDEQASDITGR